MDKSTIGKHFLSGSQNPFMAFTHGVVKIGEFLENQALAERQARNQQEWWLSNEEEMKN